MTTDVYLDGATATPLLPVARDALVAALDAYGDPLSIHAPARRARRLVDDAREAVARSIGAQPDEIVFTSGGTESGALGIWGGGTARRRGALRPARGRPDGVPVRRRPRAQAPVGDGEHPGDLRDGGRAHVVVGLDGRHGGGTLVPHIRAARGHRGHGARRARAWAS